MDRQRLGWFASRQPAARLTVSRQTVQTIGNERYDPSLPLAVAIAATFGLPIEKIFDPR